MDDTQRTYGALIEACEEYGTQYIIVRLLVREGEAHHPINGRDIESDIWDAPKHMVDMTVNGLALRGHYFEHHEGGYSLIGFQPAFMNRYSCEEKEIASMLKTIKKVNRQIEKDASTEAGDVYWSLCKALRLDWAVRCTEMSGCSYQYSTWEWMTIGEGREYLRDLIKEHTPQSKAREEAA